MRVGSRILRAYKQPFLRTIKVSILGSSLYNRSEALAKSPGSISSVFGSKLRGLEFEQTQLGFLNSSKSNMALRPKAVTEGVGLIQEAKENTPMLIKKSTDGSDSFTEMKNRFLSFKKEKYLENLDCYRELAEAQSPKFMVISCADSRVCPSYILGFQPGEAFVVRNIANLVPPFEVENILVTGHSCCGGIRALMSMEDEDNSSSFIKNWVVVGKAARSSTKATTSNLSFDQQCKHCEKESINNSLLNLLTYPWVEERVAKGLLSLHGGYYNFVDCTYEKWTLDYQRSSPKQETGGYAIKNREFWS